MAVSIQHVFSAAGGNRHPAAADWAGHLLAFGADRNVAVWAPLDPRSQGLCALLSAHTEAVNVVKFLPAATGRPTVILSGAADKTISVWLADAASPATFTKSQTLVDHAASVNTLAVCSQSDLFVSGSADSVLKIWRYQWDQDTGMLQVKLDHTLLLAPKFFPLASALMNLDQQGSHVLAVAGTKSTIQLYVAHHGPFQLAATLTGHEGWIRSLDMVRESPSDSADILLASASQDKYIRLWRLHQGDTLPAVSASSTDPALGSIAKSLSNKAHRFQAGGRPYSATFEALLIGHEDWIFTVRWNTSKGLRLLSASADSSLAIWEPDPASGVWLSSVRLGEISAQKGATTATGSTGGYWIGLWSPEGDAVTSLGRTGSWRLWKYTTSDDRWTQDVAVSGHTRRVRDLAWASDGAYILSTSADQTTRLFAQWKRDDLISWHEFSRPQIHGYDLNCIASISPSQFISGADEKLLRVFDEPKAVADSLARLCGLISSTSKTLPDAANIPVLGLSNKAITASGPEDGSAEDSTQLEEESNTIANAINAIDADAPPSEDYLARHLLWPEIEKLYGHGYEISAVAVSHDGLLVSTACRASSIEHAVMRIYETNSWREIKSPLKAHSLTVTRMAFSPDDHYLLSMGRDRQCAIFGRDANDPQIFSLVASQAKAHSRMILDGAWVPIAGRYIFATAGRDKQVKLWHFHNKVIETISSIATESAVEALAFAPHNGSSSRSLQLARGEENGSIHISSLNIETWEVSATTTVNVSISPSKSITSLAWRPTGSDDATGASQLAVASDDCSLRIYSVSPST